jgi:hypothetical protein
MPDDGAPPAACANCGSDIPPRAHACPECGADERTGWRETSIYDGLDLPEPDHETANSADPRPAFPNGLRWLWWLTAVVLLIALAAGSLTFS